MREMHHRFHSEIYCFYQNNFLVIICYLQRKTTARMYVLRFAKTTRTEKRVGYVLDNGLFNAGRHGYHKSLSLSLINKQKEFVRSLVLLRGHHVQSDAGPDLPPLLFTKCSWRV